MRRWIPDTDYCCTDYHRLSKRREPKGNSLFLKQIAGHSMAINYLTWQKNMLIAIYEPISCRAVSGSGLARIYSYFGNAILTVEFSKAVNWKKIRNE